MKSRNILLCVTVFLVAMVSFAANEKTINNVFQDTDVRQALSTIAAQAEVNLIADTTVAGQTVTLDLKDTPFEVALQMICDSGAYSFVKEGEQYLVGQAIPSNPNFPRFCGMSLIKLKNSKAEDVVKGFNQFYQPFVKACDGNALVVSAPIRILKQIEELVEKIDAPGAQIAVDCVIVEISRLKGNKFEADWSAGTRNPDLPSLEKYSFAGTEIGFTSNIVKNLMVGLDAIVQSGNGKIRANPSTMATEGKKAVIHAGQRDYITTNIGNNGYTNTQTQIVESGVMLELIAWQNKDGSITTTFSPEVSDVISKNPTTGELSLNTRSQSTTVTVLDGQTIITGGLITEKETNTKKKTPILGSIPLIGLLFQKNEKMKLNTEVVILITLHVVKNGLERAMPAGEEKAQVEPEHFSGPGGSYKDGKRIK